MAEEKDKLPNPDDDLDKLLEELDIDNFGDSIDYSGRKPETPKDIAITIVKDSITNSDFIEENLVDKVLPETLVVQKDIVKNVKDNVLDVIDSEYTEIKQIVGKLAERADKVIPDRFGKVKSILSKLKPESTGYRNSSGYEKTDEEKATDAVSRDLDSSVVLDRASYVSQLIDQVVRSKTDLTTQQIQKQQALDVAKLTQFHLTFTASYQRKSLELKYRNILILKDILVNIINFGKAFSLKLDQIVKNTALPEFVKLRSSEAVKEQIRKDIATNITQGLRSDRPITERLASGIRTKLRNLTEGIKTGMSIPLDMLETTESMGDMGDIGVNNGISPGLSTVGSMGLGFIIGRTANRIRSEIEDRLDKKGYLSTLERFNANIQSNLEQFSEGDKENDGIITKTLRRISRVLVDTIKEEDVDINVRISDMTPERVRLYEIRSKVSLVEVIPGYLARILKEIIYLGRGIETDLVVYDYNNRKFIDKTNLIKDLKKTFIKDQYGVHIAKNIANEITENKPVDQRQKDLLVSVITDLSIKGYGIDAIEKSTVYKNLPTREKEQLQKLLEDIVKDDTKVIALNKTMNSIGTSIHKPDEWIKDIIDMGRKDILLETGIVQEKNGKLELDKDKYLQWLVKEDNVRPSTVSASGFGNVGTILKTSRPEVSKEEIQISTTATNTTKTTSKEEADDRTSKKTNRVKRFINRYIQSKINKIRKLNRLTGNIGGKLFNLIKKHQDTSKLVQPAISEIQSTYDVIKRQVIANEDIDPVEKDKLVTGIDTNEKLDTINVRTEALIASVEKIVENTKPKKELRFKDELERFKRKDSGRKTDSTKTNTKKEKKPSLLEKILKSIGGISGLLAKGFTGIVDKLGNVIKSLTILGTVVKTLKSIRGGMDIDPDGIKSKRKRGRVSKSISKVTRKIDTSIIKSIGKSTGKLVGKRIPILGLGLAASYASDRFREGDVAGGVGELASGVLSTVPGIGTGASIAIDTMLAKRDMDNVKSSISDQLDSILRANITSPTVLLRRLKNVGIFAISNGIDAGNVRSILIDKLQSVYNVDKKKLSIVIDYIILASTTEIKDGKLLPPEEGVLTITEEMLANKEQINLLETNNAKNTLSKMLVNRIKNIMGKVVSSIKETSQYVTDKVSSNANNIYSGSGGSSTGNYVQGNVVNYQSVNNKLLQQAKGPINPGDIENSSLDGQKSKAEDTGIVDPGKVKQIPYNPKGKIPILQTPYETPDGGLSAINKRNAKIEGLNPVVLKNFLSMAKEYYKLTGKKINVNSAFRSYQDQLRISRSRGGYAARPGRSLHEYGLAIDINTKDADELDRMGLFRKYGFIRPLSGETWHIEPAMIQFDIPGVKKDPNLASKLAEESLGRGGSGYGAILRSKPIHRNLKLTEKIVDPNSSFPIKLEDIAKDTILDKNLTNVMGSIGVDTGMITNTTDTTTSKEIVPIDKRPIEKAVDIGRSLVPETPTNLSTTAETVSSTIKEPSTQSNIAIESIVNFSTATVENLPKMTETLMSVDDTLKASLEIQKEILQLLKDRDSIKAKEDTVPHTRRQIPIKNTDSPAISLGKQRSF